MWVEQSTERLLNLQYTGGNGSAVTATIVLLPPQGSLYQVSGGVKGPAITTVPAPVTDPDIRVIYVADGSTGNGAGNFSFTVTNDQGTSLAAIFTINVNPQGIPNVLHTAKGTGVEIQFDRPMNDPSGKEAQFTIKVNDVPVTMGSATLKAGDSRTIVLNPVTVLTGTETVTVSYTKGTVSATNGILLESFTETPVTLTWQVINFPVFPPKKYGDPDFSPGATAPGGMITYSSSVPGVASIVSNKVRINTPGNTVITAFQTGNETYASARYEQLLTVNKADQTITFNPLPEKSYGDDDFSLSATSSSGLPVTFQSDNLSVITITGTTVHIEGGGTATIFADQEGNELYNPAPSVGQELIVNKLNLNFVANDASKDYLAPLPQLTFNVTGFINNETIEDIDVMPVPVTSATADSDAGDYEITFVGGEDNNYDFLLTVGTLTINPIGQVITFGQLPALLPYGEPLLLSATSTSGLTVSFESLSQAVATVSGNTLTGVARGTANIRAYNDGNINYLPAEAFASIEITTTHRDVLYLFTPNNDGRNDLWEIPGKAEMGKCDVKVYNRWGKLVYANADYNNDWDGTSEGKPLPEGAYVFIIKSENQGVMKGTVNIVR
jgi:gliding motility-associated-like protein